MDCAIQTGRSGFRRSGSIRWIVSVCCAVALALAAGDARAAPGTYALKARLARTASTRGATRATGAFTGKLRLAGDNSSLKSTLTFRHLSGTAVRAGIYYGRSAKAAQLAMLLCNRCISGTKTYYHGSYVASSTFVRAIRRGRAYVVIQTRKNPRGELRGRLRAAVG